MLGRASAQEEMVWCFGRCWDAQRRRMVAVKRPKEQAEAFATTEDVAHHFLAKEQEAVAGREGRKIRACVAVEGKGRVRE